MKNVLILFFGFLLFLLLVWAVPFVCVGFLIHQLFSFLMGLFRKKSEAVQPKEDNFLGDVFNVFVKSKSSAKNSSILSN
jgi:hypothetical protein